MHGAGFLNYFVPARGSGLEAPDMICLPTARISSDLTETKIRMTHVRLKVQLLVRVLRVVLTLANRWWLSPPPVLRVLASLGIRLSHLRPNLEWVLHREMT
jgi:hypothetical protein